jgi:hypothetical protein
LRETAPKNKEVKAISTLGPFYMEISNGLSKVPVRPQLAARVDLIGGELELLAAPMSCANSTRPCWLGLTGLSATNAAPLGRHLLLLSRAYASNVDAEALNVHFWGCAGSSVLGHERQFA